MVKLQRFLRHKFIYIILAMLTHMIYWNGFLDITVYSSLSYVGMSPPQNGSHIKSAQLTRSKFLREIS